MNRFKPQLAMLLLIVVISGCAHPLTLKNLSNYKPIFINSEYANSTIGISVASSSPEEERLILATANSLKRDGFKVIYPFYQNEESKKSVDFIIKIAPSSEYQGSGINFLINWPGFIIFAPALFGYSYAVNFNFDVDIMDIKSNTEIPRVAIPINLLIKHADINRTWTEISWLEVSAIAFIGGIVFTGYDKSVTPMILDSYENKIGDYIASKIAAAVIAKKQSER
jgi:hypothetical protein